MRAPDGQSESAWITTPLKGKRWEWAAKLYGLQDVTAFIIYIIN